MTEPIKRKPGRPPKPPGETADARITLRLTAPRRSKLLRLGGAQWVAQAIDAAPEPSGAPIAGSDGR